VRSPSQGVQLIRAIACTRTTPALLCFSRSSLAPWMHGAWKFDQVGACYHLLQTLACIGSHEEGLSASTRGLWDKNLEGPFTIAKIPPHTCQRYLQQTLPVCLPSHPEDLTALPLHQNNNIIILYGPLDPISVPLLYYLLVIVVLVGDSRSIFIASPPHLTAPDDSFSSELASSPPSNIPRWQHSLCTTTTGHQH